MAAEATTTTLHLRIKEDDLSTFRSTCRDRYHKDPNDMLRDMIVALNDNRLRIKPTEGQQAMMNEVFEPNPEEEK